MISGETIKKIHRLNSRIRTLEVENGELRRLNRELEEQLKMWSVKWSMEDIIKKREEIDSVSFNRQYSQQPKEEDQ